jgi:hypothetical protein
MLNELYQYKEHFEHELVMAEARVQVVDEMIANEMLKQAKAETPDTKIVETEIEVAEQPTDESY